MVTLSEAREQIEAQKQQAEQGQFLGALLQGRRYNKSGKQVKK
jgi:hypothetical protein